MVGTQRKIAVGLLFGGRSAEHDVSRASAANVLRALDPNRYEVSLIGIARDGRWLVCDAGNGGGTGAAALTIPDDAPQLGLIPGGRGRFLLCDGDGSRSGTALSFDVMLRDVFFSAIKQAEFLRDQLPSMLIQIRFDPLLHVGSTVACHVRFRT